MPIVLLPLAYNRFIARTSPPIRLSPESQSNGHLEPPPELGGWKVLLLWLPALGEMVSNGVSLILVSLRRALNICFLFYFIFSFLFLASAPRDGFDVHPGIDIPDGTKFFGAIRRRPQCCLLRKEAVALPVESSFTSFDRACMLTASSFYAFYRWISLFLVMLAVILLGISSAHVDAGSGGSGTYPVDNEGVVGSSEERGEPAINVAFGSISPLSL
jgi:hypothetical protein